jgi:hypothetical protein
MVYVKAISQMLRIFRMGSEVGYITNADFGTDVVEGG